MSRDLEKHACNKVIRALEDVYQLTSDPVELAQIAIAASAVCIGGAAGFLCAMAERDGKPVDQTEAIIAVIGLIKIHFTQGPDAVMAKIAELR